MSPQVTTKPFQSRAQWAWAFATGQPWARRWAHETPGGERRRFRNLPRRVRRKFLQECRRFKATGYSARAGQVIRGNLARGGDGKFTSAGNASSAPPKGEEQRPAKPQRRRAPLTRRRGETDAQLAAREQERAQLADENRAAREQERTDQRKANIDKSFAASGLEEDEFYPLVDFADGGEPPEDAADSLIAKGLVERGRDGKLRMTPTGRRLVNAAERGDTRGVADAVSQGSDRVAGQQERATARQQRQQEQQAKRQAREAERARKRAELEKRRQERAKRGKKPRREAKPERQDTAPKPAPARRPTRRPLRPQRRPGGPRPLPTTPKPTLPTVEQAAALGLPVFGTNRGKEALAVFKDARGAERWLSITTSAYQDRDGEWISRKAIAQAVQRGDETGQRGVLRFWHTPGLDFGDCDYQAAAQDGRFLIESGTFYSPAHAAVVKAAAAKGYQMSPGFVHPATEPKAGVFETIHIFERSFVPPGRASNPYTRLAAKGVDMPVEMDAAKRKELEQLAADQPDLLQSLLARVEQTDKAAQANAVYKDAPEWAQALISQVTDLAEKVKAFEAKAPMAPAEMEETGATEMADGMAEEEAAGEAEMEYDEGPLFGPEDAAVIAQAVVEALAPLLGEMKAAMNFEKKMQDAMAEIKAGWGGQLAQKDSALAELDTRVKALEGEQPRALQQLRASQNDAQLVPSDVSTKGVQPGVEQVDAGFFSFLTGAA